MVHLHLAGGHTCRTILRSDSDLLRDLLSALAAGARGSNPPKLFQVPVRDTRGLYTFSSQELVGITTEPPVRLSERAGRTITTLETSASHEPQRIGAAASTFVQFDDFLTPDEHRQLLDYALFHYLAQRERMTRTR